MIVRGRSRQVPIRLTPVARLGAGQYLVGIAATDGNLDVSDADAVGDGLGAAGLQRAQPTNSIVRLNRDQAGLELSSPAAPCIASRALSSSSGVMRDAYRPSRSAADLVVCYACPLGGAIRACSSNIAPNASAIAGVITS